MSEQNANDDGTSLRSTGFTVRSAQESPGPEPGGIIRWRVNGIAVEEHAFQQERRDTMIATPMIHEMVRDGRATARDGALLIELRRDVRDHRERKSFSRLGCSSSPCWDFAENAPSHASRRAVGNSESGPGHRPMKTDWARTIRDQCKAHGVPFFYKQQYDRNGRLATIMPRLDGWSWREMPQGENHGHRQK